MSFYYNPLDCECKSVIGATKTNQKITFTVKTDEQGEFTLLICRDGSNGFESYPMKHVEGGFFARFSIAEKGLYWYKFRSGNRVFGRGEKLLAASGSDECFQLTVYDENYSTPDWLKGGIIYQIFPDRFNGTEDFSVSEGKVKCKDWYADPTYRSADGEVLNNEFYGGNFEGIRRKLDYLKRLGVNAIYLNPISKAYSSHRYDTGDYLKFDEVLGDEKDLVRLISDANALGIKLIFDGVYNHTGADSAYFNKSKNYPTVGAYNSENSPYFGWYTFRSFPDDYESWWGFENLPSIKKDCKDFQDFICGTVLKKYSEYGFSGVRLDVVDELDADFVKNIRIAVKSYDSQAVVIGEVWEDATNKTAYGKRREYFLGNELDSVMNYPLRDAVVNYLLTGNTRLIDLTVREQINNFPPCALQMLMNVLSTHDSPRIITVLGRNGIVTDKDEMKYEFLTPREYDVGSRLAKIAYVLVYTLYGVPSVYYGDEAGLSGNLDPYNRRAYPWGREDRDLVEFFEKLGSFRRENKVLKDGSTKILYSEDGVFVFERRTENEQIIVAVSRRKRDVLLTFSEPVADILGGGEYSKTVELKSDSAMVLKNKND